MPVPAFLNTIEQSALSTWIRQTDSIFGFYFILVFHTIGMALLVGPNAVVDLILLGFISDVPLAPFRRWFTVMWAGFWINAVSGTFLLIAYPTKALTNPVFYVKLCLIVLALGTMYAVETRIFANPGASGAAGSLRNSTAHSSAVPSEMPQSSTAGSRTLAACSLILWIAVITAGRLLAYTFRYISYGALRTKMQMRPRRGSFGLSSRLGKGSGGGAGRRRLCLPS